MDDSLIHNLFDAVMGFHKAGKSGPARQVFNVLANELFPGYIKTDYCPTVNEITIGVEEGKVRMVKAYRDRQNCSLLEAKNHCEEYFTKNNLTFKGY